MDNKSQKELEEAEKSFDMFIFDSFIQEESVPNKNRVKAEQNFDSICQICANLIKKSAKHPFPWYNLPINAVAGELRISSSSGEL